MTTATTQQNNKVTIPTRLYFRIGDVAELLGIKPYVLRYWESEFPMISPEKASSGQRVYRRKDVEVLAVIKHLLYEERYSIEGARKKIRELRREGALQTLKEEVTLLPEPSRADRFSEILSQNRAKDLTENLANNLADSSKAVAIIDSPLATDSSAASVQFAQQLMEFKILADEIKVLSLRPIEDLFAY